MNITFQQFLRCTPRERLVLFYHWVAAQPAETPYSFSQVQGCAMYLFCRQWFKSKALNPDLLVAASKGVSYRTIKENIHGSHFRWVAIFDGELSDKNTPLIRSKTLGELARGLAPLVAPFLNPPLLPRELREPRAPSLKVETRPLAA